MATRSLTDIYFLMRNNAITNKNIFHDNSYSDDRTALVIDLDSGSAKTASKLPPDWTNEVEEIQYEMTKLKNKLKELSALHDKHLNRPTMNDNVDEEKIIDQLTQELTQVLGQNQMKVRKISIRSKSVEFTTSTEKRLIKNVISNLATALQDLTTSFRTSQNKYLKKIQSRKERSNMLFDTSEYSSSSALMTEENFYDEDDANLLNLRQDQLQVQRVNKQKIDEREKEITHVVKSIQDLNEIFKDLATMIVDQGTVLDRIDYNIEKVSTHVDHGLVELQKAQKYQKANKKMYCIGILLIIFVLMFLLLVLTKF